MQDNQAGLGRAEPWHLWAVGGLAVLWNGFGAVLWGGTSFMPDSFLDGLPAAHRAYVIGLPLRSTLTWGLGVLGGVAADQSSSCWETGWRFKRSPFPSSAR